MSRKSLLLAVGIGSVIVGGTAGVLAGMILHEPEFYRRAEVPPGAQRRQWSNEFHEEVNNLLNGMINYKEWGARFTEQQINSYFEEEFLRQSAADRGFFPEGINSPRVAIDANRIRLAFRYGRKSWSTIVSLDLRVWLASGQPNVVAVEVQGMRAGSLPISLQSMLERFSEAARRQDVEMNWYRHNGKPVALLRFAPGQREPSVQLLHLKLNPGMMVIQGADRSRSAGERAAASGKAGE
jgi:hypothetical protein